MALVGKDKIICYTSYYPLKYFFKLRLGAFIPRSVGRLVGRSVGPPKITKKITELYRTLQNIEIRSPPLPHPYYVWFWDVWFRNFTLTCLVW